MNTYQLVQDNLEGNLAWEYKFTMPSDHMAVLFAEKIAKSIKNTIVLWNITDRNNTQLIGRFEVITTVENRTFIEKGGVKQDLFK